MRDRGGPDAAAVRRVRRRPGPVAARATRLHRRRRTKRRVIDCRNAIAIAEDYFAAHRTVSELSESTFFQRANETDLRYDNGSALFYAGLRDSTVVPAAASQLRAALSHSDVISRRRRAMSTVKLATLELAHGDRDEGIVLAGRALDLGEGLRSARLVGDLRRLRTAATRHTGASVDALRQQLDSVPMFV
ncbi:MAG: hypothetical protein ACT4NY_29065 [Pseudonocardiales bacterium]